MSLNKDEWPMRESFVSRIVQGQARIEQVDDEIEAWHRAKSLPKSETLARWLGFSDEEYARFVTDPQELNRLVELRTKTNDYRRRTHSDTPINPKMGEGRYQDALRRFRKRIADGVPLDEDDCNITGGKYTSASWGLCECLDYSAYPEVNDHTFPDRLADDIKRRPRRGSETIDLILMSPRDPPEGATCPMDRGLLKMPEGREVSSSGCFYRCRIFRPVKGTLPPGERVARPPTREEALKLYDDLLAKRELVYGKKTTADDGEDLWEPNGKLPKGRRNVVG